MQAEEGLEESDLHGGGGGAEVPLEASELNGHKRSTKSSKPHVRFSSTSKAERKETTSGAAKRSASSHKKRATSRPRIEERPEEKRLRYAVEDGDAGKVELCLRESGIDPGAELVRERATPLHLAAAKGHDSVVEVLLRMGAAVDPSDKDRVTPLYAQHFELLNAIVSLYGGRSRLPTMSAMMPPCAEKCNVCDSSWPRKRILIIGLVHLLPVLCLSCYC